MYVQKNTEIIQKIKKTFRKGDFYVLIERIKRKYDITFARSTIANCLDPHSNYLNPIIYSEALKLSIERQKAIGGISDLEEQI